MAQQGNRTLRGGKIVFNNGRSAIDCLVRNLSDTDGCLQFNSTVDIPNTFDLLVDGEKTPRSCRKTWASEDRIGAEFLTPHSNRVKTGAPSPSHQDPNGTEVLRAQLIALRAALDNVPIGIVLLDHEMRAQFINRACRKMWRFSDSQADRKLPLVALLYHSRDMRAYAVSPDTVDSYIAQRIEHVKRGDPTPLDVRLASGEVIRMQSAVLPNGGRMLCYTYVTDIITDADELETLRAALDNIDQGVILLDSMLNAQFMNRAVRNLWHVSDEQADRKPPYIELVSDARKTGTFDVPPDQLNDFIANRVARVRAGDPTPIDIPHGDGRVIRAQCAVLPGGGRMLTYTEVTDLVHRAAQFEELAAIDGLTGVCNRRQFNCRATAEWTRFQRYHRPLAALMLDIDHFKQINDAHGHEEGDRALTHVAQLCKQESRTTDIIGRIGGDEFIILMPETTLDQARAFAERLREKVVETPLRHDRTEGNISVRISGGIAEATVSMASIDALIRLADRALYQSKAAGRNCVSAAQSHSDCDHRAAE